MLSITRPLGGLPSAKTHPKATSALFRAKDILFFCVNMIYATVLLAVLLALLYDNGPGIHIAQVVIWGLIFVFFFSVGVLYAILQTNRNQGSNGCSAEVNMGLMDPDLVFSSGSRGWRYTAVKKYGGLVGWLFGATALAIHILVLIALVRWMDQLQASEKEFGLTLANMFAIPILIAGIALSSMNVARAACSMVIAASWALWQWNTPEYERMGKRSWSGLWHIGSYLV